MPSMYDALCIKKIWIHTDDQTNIQTATLEQWRPCFRYLSCSADSLLSVAVLDMRLSKACLAVHNHRSSP